jgi:hypothetical protein
MDAPLDPQLTIGRIFGNDWTIANVAKLLRFNGGQSFLRTGPQTGGMRDVQQDYLRRTSARHIPTGVTVTFRRDESGNWIAGLCFADLEHYLPWNDAVAEEWLNALFLEHRPNVRECTEAAAEPGMVRYFKLAI